MPQRKLSSEIAIPAIRELLDRDEHCRVVVTGSSMWPFLRHERDAVILSSVTAPLHPGDIIFYLRTPTVCVLHRIIRPRADGLWDVTGDAQTSLEPVHPRQVLGVVTEIERGDRRFPCTQPLWRALCRVWRSLLPWRGRVLHLLRLLSKNTPV